VNAAEERVAIVDDHNQVVGEATRREMRARRLPHRSTYILVFNSRGELFVHKRTRTKDVHPGFYDPVAGGVVLAGETYEEGAARELAEELGLRSVPLRSHFDFYLADETVRVWGRAFSCVQDGPFELQPEEIESGTFLAPEEAIRRARTEPYTPDGLYVLCRFLAERRAEEA
jgi:8-oxo-dGTP pyrophosphatase MutT (NUDIX family)